jgi:hypothetical protein
VNWRESTSRGGARAGRRRRGCRCSCAEADRAATCRGRAGAGQADTRHLLPWLGDIVRGRPCRACSGARRRPRRRHGEG